MKLHMLVLHTCRLNDFWHSSAQCTIVFDLKKEEVQCEISLTFPLTTKLPTLVKYATRPEDISICTRN